MPRSFGPLGDLYRDLFATLFNSCRVSTHDGERFPGLRCPYHIFGSAVVRIGSGPSVIETTIKHFRTVQNRSRVLCALDYRKRVTSSAEMGCNLFLTSVVLLWSVDGLEFDRDDPIPFESSLDV